MGKQNFCNIYRTAEEKLGHRPTIKISFYCDKFDPNSSYAGMIVYHTYGEHKWRQRRGQGVAGGHRGQSFYVLILCTDNWPRDALQAAGRGRVHDYLYRQYFATEFTRGRTCCAGFAVLQGQAKFSSIYLNMQSGDKRGLKWRSDGSKYVSEEEKVLIEVAIAAWKDRGRGVAVQLPDSVHERVTQGQTGGT